MDVAVSHGGHRDDGVIERVEGRFIFSDHHTRDPEKEHVFELRAGDGMHQPQNSPHWVRTGPTRAVSYVFSFETNRSRAMGRTRAFNYYQRRAGVPPAAPGHNPRGDALKAAFMQIAIPTRHALGDTFRRLHR